MQKISLESFKQTIVTDKALRSWQMDSRIMLDILTRALKHVSRDKMRPFICGVNFVLYQNRLVVEVTDGHKGMQATIEDITLYGLELSPCEEHHVRRDENPDELFAPYTIFFETEEIKSLVTQLKKVDKNRKERVTFIMRHDAMYVDILKKSDSEIVRFDPNESLTFPTSFDTHIIRPEKNNIVKEYTFEFDTKYAHINAVEAARTCYHAHWKPREKIKSASKAEINISFKYADMVITPNIPEFPSFHVACKGANHLEDHVCTQFYPATLIADIFSGLRGDITVTYADRLFLTDVCRGEFSHTYEVRYTVMPFHSKVVPHVKFVFDEIERIKTEKNLPTERLR